MTRMSEAVRQLVGLENLLMKARRRFRESEREGQIERAANYRKVVERISDEIHSADRERLREYLGYLEADLLPRMGNRVEETVDAMIQAGLAVVDARHHIVELRSEYSDALDRIRAVRERLGAEPFKAPTDVRFGPGMPPPHSDRRTREAIDMIKGYLKS